MAWAPVTQAALDDQQANAFAPMFKALGDPVRLRLLSMIASAGGGEVCVCDLTGEFALDRPDHLAPPQGAARGRPGATATAAAPGSTTASCRPRWRVIAGLVAAGEVAAVTA